MSCRQMESGTLAGELHLGVVVVGYRTKLGFGGLGGWCEDEQRGDRDGTDKGERGDEADIYR